MIGVCFVSNYGGNPIVSTHQCFDIPVFRQFLPGISKNITAISTCRNMGLSKLRYAHCFDNCRNTGLSKQREKIISRCFDSIHVETKGNDYQMARAGDQSKEWRHSSQKFHRQFFMFLFLKNQSDIDENKVTWGEGVKVKDDKSVTRREGVEKF